MRLLAILLALLLTTAAWADESKDSDEPTPPSSDEPTAPGASKKKAKPANSDEPAAPAAKAAPANDDPNEPTAPGAATKLDKDEPGGADDAIDADPIATAAAKKIRPAVEYGIGLQLRGIFVPEWFLGMFLDASTGLSSMSLGGEFIRRKGNFDIVASINFGFLSPDDGNYLGKGERPQDETDYMQFRNLNLLAFDIAFIGHHHFNNWLSFKKLAPHQLFYYNDFCFILIVIFKKQLQPKLHESI